MGRHISISAVDEGKEEELSAAYLNKSRNLLMDQEEIDVDCCLPTPSRLVNGDGGRGHSVEVFPPLLPG